MTRDVARLGARTFDVLVVGGGIYGLTIAADAAQRGLSVALVERDDFGSGTTFNHLRTIHGGLRYLQSLDLERARESILERRTLARIAPHAVQPMPFVLPLTSRFIRGPLMMRAGFLLDALIARDRNDGVPDHLRLPAGQVLTAAEARRRFPLVDQPRLVGAALWHDYVTVESDRLTLSWGLLAARHGAELANHAEATRLLADGTRIVGAQVVDRLTDRHVDVAARLVVNATGADLDRLLADLQAPTGMPLLRAVNLVTRLAAGGAAIGGQAASGRALFMVPWRGRALFGTFESATFCQADATRPTDDEVARFVAEVASAFPGSGLTRDDVTLVHRGVVPARAANGGVALEGHQRVRDHANGARALDGLISIAGTKYTTARSVAEQITDRVLTKLGRPPVPSRTAGTLLAGTDDASAPAALTSTRADLPGDVRAHLAAAYGPAAERIESIAASDPALAARVSDDSPVIAAQIAWAVQHEMAVTLADAVIRRTALGALGHPGEAALSRAAAIMSTVCGWDPERRDREVCAVREFYER